MRRFLSVLLAFLAVTWAAPVTAQTTLTAPSIQWANKWGTTTPTSIIGYDSGTSAPCIVGSTATCNVPTSGSAPRGTQDTNLLQVGGVTLLRGSGATGTGSQRVTVAVDSATVAGSATLPAGSAIIGKVGIDQTTPGTTNAVSTPFSTPFEAQVSWTPSGNLLVGSNMGGLFTLDMSALTGVNMANAWVRVADVGITMGATSSVAVNTSFVFFDANPNSTTFTDGSVTSLNSADRSKVKLNVGVSYQIVYFSNTGVPLSAVTIASAGYVKCTSGGLLYLAIQSGAAATLSSIGTSYATIHFLR